MDYAGLRSTRGADEIGVCSIVLNHYSGLIDDKSTSVERAREGQKGL